MNTITLILAGTGCLFWLIAVIRDSLKKTMGYSPLKKVFGIFVQKTQIEEQPPSPPFGMVTIESLEEELGITPDVYLCDRIARINEVLIARRDGTKTKKGGTK